MSELLASIKHPPPELRRCPNCKTSLYSLKVRIVDEELHSYHDSMVGKVCRYCGYAYVLGEETELKELFHPKTTSWFFEESEASKIYFLGRNVGYLWDNFGTQQVIIDERKFKKAIRVWDRTRGRRIHYQYWYYLWTWLCEGGHRDLSITSRFTRNVKDLVIWNGQYCCPKCPYATSKPEILGTHILRNHPEIWERVGLALRLPIKSCTMVQRRGYGVNDFLFELMERPKQDSESIFSDDEFLDKFFGSAEGETSKVKKIRHLVKEATRSGAKYFQPGEKCYNSVKNKSGDEKW